MTKAPLKPTAAGKKPSKSRAKAKPKGARRSITKAGKAKAPKPSASTAMAKAKEALAKLPPSTQRLAAQMAVAPLGIAKPMRDGIAQAAAQAKAKALAPLKPVEVWNAKVAHNGDLYRRLVKPAPRGKS